MMSNSKSYQEDLIKDQVQAVLLIKQAAPEPAFFYVMMPLGKVAEFKAATAAGSLDVRQWGRVLHEGSGEPSDAVKLAMQAEYGCAADGMALTLPSYP